MAKKTVAKKTIKQKYSVTLRIGTPVTIPWESKKGVTLVLRAGGKKIGAIRVTGSRVHVRRAGKVNWKSMSFQQCLDRLID